MNTFLISNEKAVGPGFGLFSADHFFALAILALISFGLICAYLRANDERRKLLRLLVASFTLLLEIIRDIILVMTHQFLYADLPFQLCGLGIFIIVFDAMRSTKTSRELLYSLTLPGAIFALVTPNWVTNNFINVFVWQSFLIHCLLISYVLMRLIAGDLVPQWREIWRSAIFLAIVVPICAVLNQVWNQNFFFLRTPVPGSPLEPISNMFGSYYILGLIFIVLIFWLLIYLPWSWKKSPKVRMN